MKNDEQQPETAVESTGLVGIWTGQQVNPLKAGWHYVREENGAIGMRYYDDSDDGSWWHTSRRYGWCPNISFTAWLWLPGVSDA